MQTIEDLARYAMDNEWAALSEWTRACYATRCRRVVSALGGPGRKVTELTPAARRQAITQWAEEGLAPKTINEYLATFHTLFEIALAHGLVEDIPQRRATKKFVRVRKVVPYAMTREECVALLDFCNSRIGKMWRPRRVVFPLWIEFMLETGLRVSEALPDPRTDTRPALWSHVREIATRNGTKIPALLVRGKGRKERYVPLSPRAHEIARTLHAYNARFNETGEGPLFQAMTLTWAQRRLKRFARYARVGGENSVTPHTLRRTFATQWIADGGDPAGLKEVLGHTSLQTTMRYVAKTPWLAAESAMRLFEYRAEDQCAAQGGD